MSIVTEGKPATASSDSSDKISDTLPQILEGLFHGQQFDALIFGDTRVINHSVFEYLMQACSRLFVVERGYNEKALVDQYKDKVKLLKSARVVAPDALTAVIGCPVLSQIVPTLRERASGEIWRTLKSGGYFITFGVSLQNNIPPDIEMRAFFERYFTPDSREMPPQLAAKFEFVDSRLRTPGGKSYLSWVVLRKKSAANAVLGITRPQSPRSRSNRRVSSPNVGPTPVLEEADNGGPLWQLPSALKGVPEPDGIVFSPDSKSIDNLVFSIVPNPCVVDARVLRHARALTEAGYRVRIYATIDENLPLQEHRNGFEIYRFPGFRTDTRLAAAIELIALDSFGPYRNYMEERLRHFRQATRLNEMMSAENQRLRAHLRSAVEEGERLLLRESVSEFAAIFRCAIPHLRAQSRNEFSRLRYFFLAANFLSQVFDAKPRIVHAHDLASLPGAVQLAKAANAKLIFDAHELETERAPPLPIDHKRFIDAVELWWLDQVDRIVTVCDSAADFYAARFKGERPTVFMNVPDEFDGEKAAGFDLRKAANVSADAHVIVYTGALGREPRGLHKVVEALPLLPSAHLVILGPRHSANDAWLFEIAAEHRVADRVHLLPPVETNQVVDAIRDADVGVCPIQDVALSYRISMPNKLFECAFAEIPICVSNLPEMANFVTSLGVGVVMDQTDPAAIARAITTVLQDRGSYTLTAESRKRLSEEYAWPTQAARLRQLYRGILGRDEDPGTIAHPDNAAAATPDAAPVRERSWLRKLF